MKVERIASMGASATATPFAPLKAVVPALLLIISDAT